MNLHSLSNTSGARKPRKRVGRGRASGLGKTSGRGHKGQKARSGYSSKPGFEGGQMPLARRLPKRGFKNINRIEYRPVNVAALASFDEGADIGLEALVKAGLIRNTAEKVKILGQGDLDNKVTVHAHAFSTSARKKIEAAGGQCEVLR